MSVNLSLSQPLQSRLWSLDQQLKRNLLLIIAGISLLIVASKIEIPLAPVPITLQTMAVFFIGMTYGWRLGLITVTSYILLGAMGLPLFANWEPGYMVLMGSTSGYILSFIPAMAVAGWLVQRGWGQNFITVLFAQLIASLIIYAIGLSVLSQFIGTSMAIDFGLKPFLLTDLIKMIALSFIIPRFWRSSPNY